MMETERLSEKILGSLERHRREVAEEQKLIDSRMNALLEQRERFAAVAGRLMESTIRPRMDELARHFDNASTIEQHGNSDFRCSCYFSHTPRFPATVSFSISLLPGKNPTDLTIRYDLHILPMLMEYERDEEKVFTLDNSEGIARWTEDKILEFIDTYLRLEIHPLYQKENLVLDPVCGMRISAIAAPSRIEMPGRTIYFCSEACREAFSQRDE